MQVILTTKEILYIYTKKKKEERIERVRIFIEK